VGETRPKGNFKGGLGAGLCDTRGVVSEDGLDPPMIVTSTEIVYKGRGRGEMR
jgi:hypothetical protein